MYKAKAFGQIRAAPATTLHQLKAASTAHTSTYLADSVANACQQKSNTVMWWYQCRKISGFLRSTMKSVSTSSGTCSEQ